MQNESLIGGGLQGGVACLRAALFSNKQHVSQNGPSQNGQEFGLEGHSRRKDSSSFASPLTTPTRKLWSKAATTAAAWVIGFALLAIGALGTCGALAQVSPVSSGKVSKTGDVFIQFEDVTLENALQRLARETGVDLAYRSSLVQGRDASCQIRSADPERLLSCVLSGTGVSYVRGSGGTYILRESQRDLSPYGVTGTVIDARTGAPLSGANVHIDGTSVGTASDETGRFSLSDIPAGTHWLTASIVGYESDSRMVTIPSQRDSGRVVRFELRPAPIELAPVVVEDDRTRWLARLEEFRRSFFGTAPNSDQCSLVNPEVLSFDKRGRTLIAHAKRPLRMHNQALGYKVTFHRFRYRDSPSRRMRHGSIEFDTLRASSSRQRSQWKEARRETYVGSLEHFLDALDDGTPRSKGFRIWISEKPSWEAWPGDDAQKVRDISKIFSHKDAQGQAVLSVPSEGDFLQIQYLNDSESRAYARQHRVAGMPDGSQASAIHFVGGNELHIDLNTGAVIKGRVVLKGYWGWRETVATLLPGHYRPVPFTSDGIP